MQFEAELVEGEHMREFFHVFSTLSKLTRECVLNLLPEKMCAVANEESGSVAPFVWADINHVDFFHRYIVQSCTHSRTSPVRLVLTASPVHLCRALGALRLNAIRCRMKLIELQYHCLRMEVEVPSQTSDQSRLLVNDVPVTIVPEDQWEMYRIPMVLDSSMVIGIAPIRWLRILLEHLNNLTPSIIFRASTDGELNLTANTDMATITTRYKNQEVLVASQVDNASNSSICSSSCPVDCKKVSVFLSGMQVTIRELICGIEEDHFVRLTARIQSGVAMHALFPAIDI